MAQALLDCESMSTRGQHIFVALSIFGWSTACGADAAADSKTSARARSTPAPASCAPFELGVHGESYKCQGTGNGWLDIAVYPVGAQNPECLNWGDQGPPKHPKIEDCISVNIDLMPDGVPTPGACCGTQASPEQIIQQCSVDCGYAACNVGIAEIRNAALALPTKGGKGILRLDLFYLADLLESPEVFQACAQQVTAANGKFTAIQLGSGASKPAHFGHLQSATLHLQCVLDSKEPYILLGDTCDGTPNTPTAK